jgi:CDP-diacylglycerol---glycerol-3-phosphate 3-phosphatidyltransferase
MATSAEPVAPLAPPRDLPRGKSLDVWVVPANERLFTPATIITFLRTALTAVLMAWGIHENSLTWLVVGLVTFWVGDSLDGQVARRGHCESRIGAVIDIMSDRFSAAAFYLGLAWLHHEYVAPVLIYLAEYMVVDCFLSIAFLAWPVRSPNYFYVIDRKLWLLNWSHPGKATNSGLFAILLLATRLPWLGVVVASALLVFKCTSLAKVLRLGLPVPPRPPYAEPAPEGPMA